jgi:hypothetical protein
VESLNKQIEEMVIALHESQHEYDKAWHECFQNKGKRPERENVFYAKYLVEKKGYRKQSEVAREIFAEIEKEIIAALKSNFDIYAEQLDKQNPYMEELVQCVKGKIAALRGIQGFIEELKKKYGGAEDGK